MSLISFRNFVTPLQNKMTVGAIIVVAVLVAVARLSANSIHNADNRSRSETVTPGEADDIDNSIRDFLAAKDDPSARAGLDPNRVGKPHGSAPRGDDFLNQLMEKDTEGKKPVPSHKNDQPGGLQDIKKSLGLE